MTIVQRSVAEEGQFKGPGTSVDGKLSSPPPQMKYDHKKFRF